MTRTQAITLIETTLPKLDDERVEVFAQMLQYAVQPSVYATMPDEEKTKIHTAIGRFERGENGVHADDAFARLSAVVA